MASARRRTGNYGCRDRLPGIAHGWAGFLYATLQWCSVSKAGLPKGIERRLVELGALALPIDRGMDWPWVLGQSGEPPLCPAGAMAHAAMSFSGVWLIACSVIRATSELAYGAAWRSWDAPEQMVDPLLRPGGKGIRAPKTTSHQ